MFCSKCGYKIELESKFCTNCGARLKEDSSKSSLPESDDLLKGLYSIQEHLKKISGKLERFWELEREYRSELSRMELESLRDKSHYGLFLSGIAFSLVMIFASLIGGNLSATIFAIGVTLIYSLGKIKGNKKMLRLGGFMIILIIVNFLKRIPSSFAMSWKSGIGYLGFHIIGFILAYNISRAALDKYNARIDQHNQNIRGINENITRERSRLSIEINSLNKRMKAESGYWFPEDYYALDAVDKFISYVRNREADTVKEMLALYKEDKYRSSILNNMSEFNSRLDLNLENQQEMMKLQRTSNMLLMGSFVTGLVTAKNTHYIGKEAKRREEIRKRKNWLGF